MERTFAFVPLAAMCLVNYVPRSVGFLRERFGRGGNQRFPGFLRRRGAGTVVPRDLVFRCVLFKQAPMRGYASHFVNDGCVLKLAVCQPNLHNAEILFG